MMAEYSCTASEVIQADSEEEAIKKFREQCHSIIKDEDIDVVKISREDD